MSTNTPPSPAIPPSKGHSGLIREGSYFQQREDRHTAEVDVQEMIDKSKCADLYYKLEECLGEYDREWRKCQNEVKLLKECSKEVK
jgi:hypothetical protein